MVQEAEKLQIKTTGIDHVVLWVNDLPAQGASTSTCSA